MKHFMIFVCACVLGSLASAKVAVQQLTAEKVELIAKAQNMPASKIDKKLPAVRLADWLQAQGGPDAGFTWAFRSAAGTPEARGVPDCVEAVATLKNDQTFMVSIAVGKDARHPSFQAGWVVINRHEIIDLERLSDLPGAMAKLNKANENSSHTEAKNE